MAWLQSLLTNANPLDLLAGVIAIIFAVSGALRGISGGIGNPLALVCTAFVVWFLRSPLYGLIGQALGVFLLLAVGGIILYLLLRRLFSSIISVVIQQPLDSILGCAFGLFKVYIILALAHTFGLLQYSDRVKNFFDQDTISSRLIDPVARHFGGR